jgi:sterol O-acyltransferase
MVISTSLRNYKETGNLLALSQWKLFTENIWELAASEFLMAASCYVCLGLQIMFNNGTAGLHWRRTGMVIQSLFQAAWLAHWIGWPFVRTWTWTAQVFFTMHILTLVMKMHSYAFYNGHLSETRRRLQALDKPETASKKAAVRYPSAATARLQEVQSISDSENTTSGSSTPDSVSHLREDLALELTSPLGNVTYPANLTMGNFTDYLFCPTLCYELEYPRTDGTNLTDLFFKTLAIFGCIFLLTVTSEEFTLPVLAESAARMLSCQSASERALILAESVSRLLFPFMVSFLLVFLVIFEYILGAFAEITCFADRHFYSDWWNSCDWLEFSREWNIPVHNFFRRHVYFASKNHMSRGLATFVTFVVSALAHELVMGCITKKLRGYGFFMMMLQMPIVMVQRSKWVKGRTLMNVSWHGRSCGEVTNES